jgi:glycosyltransferase XagB
MRSDRRNRLVRHVAPRPAPNPDAILAQVRRAGQLAEPPAPPDTPHSQYGFLSAAGMSSATVAGAEAEAHRLGVGAHEVLLSAGAITPSAYALALAAELDVPLADWSTRFALTAPEDAEDALELGLLAEVENKPCRVLCAEDGMPDVVSQRVAALRARGLTVALASRQRVNAVFEEICKAERMDRAVAGLLREQPSCSAAAPTRYWQIVAAAAAVGLIVGGLSVQPDATLAALTGMVALPFLCVTALRVAGLREVVAGWRRPKGQRGDVLLPGNQPLPIYSVLVPMFRETKVLPGMVQSLKALDYPKAKLEIFLVLEEVDIEMQAAVLDMRLPSCFRTILVPDQAPRTKPKALNYALQFAKGDYVVVYDAEDRPEPDQLLRALTTFRLHPPTLGCVQAQLNIYNPRASWIARQFTIEYSALFDAVLPALARLGMPVPLGGTSNHFPRETLVACGGWDPCNVTEDADLGFRLARRGLRTAILASTTWEEAPVNLGQWVKQRTRWLKGWLQTYLVHTRQPFRLTAELGVRGALGVRRQVLCDSLRFWRSEALARLKFEIRRLFAGAAIGVV